jgi:hypothetical protein
MVNWRECEFAGVITPILTILQKCTRGGGALFGQVTSMPIYKKLPNLAREMKTKIQRTSKTRPLVPVELLEKLAFCSGLKIANIAPNTPVD